MYVVGVECGAVDVYPVAGLPQGIAGGEVEVCFVAAFGSDGAGGDNATHAVAVIQSVAVEDNPFFDARKKQRGGAHTHKRTKNKCVFSGFSENKVTGCFHKQFVICFYDITSVLFGKDKARASRFCKSKTEFESKRSLPETKNTSPPTKGGKENKTLRPQPPGLSNRDMHLDNRCGGG